MIRKNCDKKGIKLAIICGICSILLVLVLQCLIEYQNRYVSNDELELPTRVYFYMDDDNHWHYRWLNFSKEV